MTPHPTTALVTPTHGRLRPLGIDEVQITGGFWAERQLVNAKATLGHIEHWLEREGWTGNFDRAAAGTLPTGRRGREFSDSEVYKLLEAMAWEIGRSDDESVESRFRALVARVARAQEPDGYLNTRFGRPGQPGRWSDLEWGHELYCLGHLFQAAVARARTRPGSGEGLLAVARRAADLVCEVFGPDGRDAVCGHPEIEPALVELARVTGEPRYLAQAELFVRRRGHETLADVEWGRSYFQDDVPVRQATVLRGHAVRAGYLAAGAVDVAVETNDTELLAALRRQWQHTVARRTYLTGGQGSHHQDEAFGDDWVLPPDRAYSETCAGVGSVMFSWRMLLAEGHPQYADLIERTLFNVIATSPSHQGTAFFYANTLQQRRPGTVAADDVVSPRASSSLRAPWFEVSCCPPNVARTLAGLAGYVATADDEGVQLHQYAAASIRTALPDGREIALDVETDYPRAGIVRIRIRNDATGPWTLGLRVPSWATGARLVRRPVGAEPSSQEALPGVVTLRRAFRSGDVVELQLPLSPRLTAPDPRIDAVRGSLAVEHGPEVLCLESVDLARATQGRITDVADVRLDPAVPLRLVDGVVTATFRALVAETGGLPYRPYPNGFDDHQASADRATGSDVCGPGIEVALVPYHEWAERGPSTMRVWLPVVQAHR